MPRLHPCGQFVVVEAQLQPARLSRLSAEDRHAQVCRDAGWPVSFGRMRLAILASAASRLTCKPGTWLTSGSPSAAHNTAGRFLQPSAPITLSSRRTKPCWCKSGQVWVQNSSGHATGEFESEAQYDRVLGDATTGAAAKCSNPTAPNRPRPTHIRSVTCANDLQRPVRLQMVTRGSATGMGAS